MERERSPHILHLIGQLSRGGAEQQLIQLASALAARGWSQTVVSFNPGDVWEKRLRDQVTLEGVPRTPIKLRRLWHLTALVRKVCPDLVHSWSHHTSVYASWILTRRRPPRIVSFRGIPTVDRFTGETRSRIKSSYAYEHADCVVSNSRAALEAARSVGLRLPRTEVFGNIVRCVGRAPVGDATPVPRVVAAGDLIPLKAFDILLEALALLASEGRRFELLLIGEGRDRTRLECMVETLGLSGAVRFLGQVEDVSSHLLAAHLLAHPSRSEGLSNTVLEGMAAGLPVVATNVGGIPEVITDGENGLLVPPDRPELLASKIRELLLEPSLRQRLGSAAGETVRQTCNVETVTSSYETLYRDLLSPVNARTQKRAC